MANSVLWAFSRRSPTAVARRRCSIIVLTALYTNVFRLDKTCRRGVLGR